MSDETYDVRSAKLAQLRELGLDPYAVEKFKNDFTIAHLVQEFATLAPAEGEDPSAKSISLAGRIVGLCDMGKAKFLDLSDGDSSIQIFVKSNSLSENEWSAAGLMDLGDHLGITGYLFTTRTGEKSVHATSFQPLSKSLVMWPLGKEKDGHKWYGLTDVEQRYRHRHLDLVCNPENRRSLLQRSQIVQAVREYFWSQAFIEVETPMLQLQAGGAAARPFTTHYNAYELDVKLRISLELYLKRVLCGDVPKVFEVGRVFRNEGVSNRHNPEFTLLEWYESYVNLEDTQLRVEKCFEFVTNKVFGTTVVNGFDFSKPWKRVDLLEAITTESGISAEELSDLDTAKQALKRVGIDPTKESHIGGIIEKLLERFVEPKLQEPTFVVGYPLETSPLAKKDPSRPGFTRRSEGYVFGREVCNLFSEINDPLDQRERFEHQVKERAAGDEEAHPMDEEFLYALESGMPPAGGCGIGLDRMAMLLTGAEHVREILFFPMMKPVEGE